MQLLLKALILLTAHLNIAVYRDIRCALHNVHKIKSILWYRVKNEEKNNPAGSSHTSCISSEILRNEGNFRLPGNMNILQLVFYFWNLKIYYSGQTLISKPWLTVSI